MMHNWFTCKIRYEKTMENGMNKKVTEPYLVDALSFTEAESRIIEEMTPFFQGEFVVAGVARANYEEIFPSDEECADRWYKCKLWKNVQQATYWCKLPTFATPSRSWTKE